MRVDALLRPSLSASAHAVSGGQKAHSFFAVFTSAYVQKFAYERKEDRNKQGFKKRKERNMSKSGRGSVARLLKSQDRGWLFTLQAGELIGVFLQTMAVTSASLLATRHRY